MQVIELTFDDTRELYSCFMPFFKNGGLFIRAPELLPMGTEVQLKVMLPDALEFQDAKGVVSWHTPKNTQHATPPGYGVALDGDSTILREKIEVALGHLLKSSDPTFTL
ncbi:PilZ domain-containing protein [Algicola sagamiensis]|uniref:PilZ domain-containing protein n=1 Tax=Algicola sagamiensis TaxID=163869 RepID=UPI00036C3A2B|nr:PilZ domain-containing protein [Algicola sagamiensis]